MPPDYLSVAEDRPITTDEWLAASLAAAPPLSPGQIAALRRIFRPVIDTINNAAEPPPSLPG
jgi:hypothetical protein